MKCLVPNGARFTLTLHKALGVERCDSLGNHHVVKLDQEPCDEKPASRVGEFFGPALRQKALADLEALVGQFEGVTY